MISNFRAVGEFHKKFQLAHALDETKPRLIDGPLRDFRLKFLKEELKELEEGYDEDNLAKIADALVDLVYVALGTAHLHGLPWEKLFAEVQRENMRKERCEIDHRYQEDLDGVCCEQPPFKHSVRGNINDVIKPPDWTAPKIHEVLLKAGWPGHPLPMEAETT